MARYRLHPDEVVILKSETVLHGRGPSGRYGDELVLTSRHLIHVSKGALGGIKDLKYYPLGDIKLWDGHTQAMPAPHGGSYHLEVQFVYGDRYFSFNTPGKKAPSQWADAIDRIVTGNTAPRFAEEGWVLPGAAMVAGALKGTIDQFRSVLGSQATTPAAIYAAPSAASAPPPVSTPVPVSPPAPKPQTTGRCTGCTAPLFGDVGSIATCEYCGTRATLQ